MRIASLFTVALATLALAACGPDPSDGDDISLEPDAETGDSPDANTTAAKQIGDTCVPDQANPMGPGDCGTGMTCLALDGGGGSWCSKSCTSANDTCAAGYTGPGIPGCVLGVDFNNDNMSDGTYCLIICNDVAGDPMICNPATACTGECPGTLSCTAALSGGMPAMHVADGCI